MTTFLTSDSHFFHKNINSFCNRPYESVEEMNEDLILKWNSVVSHNDTVLHLGDFCFHGYDNWASILDRLNGKISLCKGNHDDSKTLKKLVSNGYFEEIHQVGHYMKINKYQLWLTHYPMQIGLRPRKFSISGHLHEEPNKMLNQLNLGVDSQLSIVKNRPFGQPVHIDELVTYLDYINPQLEEAFIKERGN